MVLTTFIKYLLHTIDLQSENPWDNKAVYMLYTELFTGTTRSGCTCRITPLMLVVTRLAGCSSTPAFLSLSLGFIKVLLYIAFMTIMIKVHTFPLFAIRPMYLAMRYVCLRFYYEVSLSLLLLYNIFSNIINK